MIYACARMPPGLRALSQTRPVGVSGQAFRLAGALLGARPAPIRPRFPTPPVPS